MSEKKTRTTRAPSYAEAYLCVVLVFGLVIGAMILGVPVQATMLFASVIATVFAYRLGYSWDVLEKAIAGKLGQLAPTVCILWLIGLYLGANMFSGTLPLLVKYGFEIISPKFLYVSALLVCSVLSVMTGSSWTSVATGGIACITNCRILGGNDAIMAGAIISGAIFGDKISPMSETTNLAPACVGNTLWSHIHAQLFTTIPAMLVAIVFYTLLGLHSGGVADIPENATEVVDQLDQIFNLNPVLLLPVIVLLVLAVTQKPTIPSLLISSVLALIVGVIVQGPAFTMKVATNAAIKGFTVSSVAPEGMEILHDVSYLLNRGGMISMANTVMICYTGFALTAILIRCGILDKAVEPLMHFANTRVKAVFTAELAIFVVHAVAGISYLSSVFVGAAWKKCYVKNKIGLPALSRTLEDVGTTVSCLFPWGQSGAFYVATLGVSIYGANGYFKYLTLSYLCPIIALLLAVFNIGMFNLSDDEQAKLMAEIEEEEGNMKSIAEMDA